LAVVGGGLSGAAPLFLPSLVDELKSDFTAPDGTTFRRLASRAFNLDDPEQLGLFLRGDTREVDVPGTSQTVRYDPLQRIGVGISRLGTSEAIAIGAYAFALKAL
jgi:glucokinase